MIKLNLLPQKVRDAERMQLIVLLGALAILLGLAGLGWRWMLARAAVAAVQQSIDAVQAELNAPELREMVQAVDRFTRDEKEKSDKASVVNALRRRQATLPRLLDALPDWMMGGQAWLQAMEVKVERAERRVELQGQALSPLVFANFYTDLGSQPVVKGLKIESPPVAVVERGRSVMAFRVSFTLEDYQ